ncbi:hypothetical protein AY599_24190 [Leptolyngbya valderiana BDU 20041]|nr:hypothetical protein AY599_24190 [Leptolyngbya valderiana BDU 20041]
MEIFTSCLSSMCDPIFGNFIKVFCQANDIKLSTRIQKKTVILKDLITLFVSVCLDSCLKLYLVLKNQKITWVRFGTSSSMIMLQSALAIITVHDYHYQYFFLSGAENFSRLRIDKKHKI